MHPELFPVKPERANGLVTEAKEERNVRGPGRLGLIPNRCSIQHSRVEVRSRMVPEHVIMSTRDIILHNLQ